MCEMGQFFPHSLALFQRRLQLVFSLLPLQFGGGAGSEDLKQVDGPRVGFHWLVIQNPDVADDTVHVVEHGNAQVAFCLPIPKALIAREQALHFLPVMANLAMKHLFAGCIGDVKLEVLPKAVALPEGQRAGMLLVITSCDKGIAGAQRLRHVLQKTREEVAARGRRRARYDKPECVLGLLSFSDIADKASKYAAPVRGQFSERDFHGELLPILAKASKLGTLPVDMPLAGSQVAPEPILVEFLHEFRHQYGQGFSNQFSRLITKDSRGCRISKLDRTALISADHGIIGRFDHNAMLFFAVPQLLLSPLVLCDIHYCAYVFNIAGLAHRSFTQAM